MKKIDFCKQARGGECAVRIPGICNVNPKTSVLAHYRLVDTCGTGGCKPDDLQGAISCNGCHDAIDRRTKTEYIHHELKLMRAEGVMRTLAIWRREGFV
ncbi:DUF1364 domain-containing protein [Lelliottia sp. V106_10]|uniref:DUF1364 domain-containing protein n=1 Tax=Lelliottia wanjuensis TaxID=3050585 RepID=UPI00254D4412|nr:MULTISPECIES: DUF1364 domain-containing protein [unclassified Lelliottia]MDK9356419.1 DUF1364 domain-containing protein [Lelliottia sp. V106_16]MDK9375726.1 DUF1364 domain-containing protein [Lelliottia sp. V106_10]MDK9602276.1 DUF1364 domain-containing protein [Lelliottia sp. V106_5]